MLLLFQWYLHNKCKSRSMLLMPVLQALCILWAMFCSLTRITDHRHHWWDVLAGSVIGIVITTYIVSMNIIYDLKGRDLRNLTPPPTRNFNMQPKLKFYKTLY